MSSHNNSSQAISSFINSAVSYTSSEARPLRSRDTMWGQVEEDPEMRADDDFLEYFQNHQHTHNIGPAYVGTIVPASGTASFPNVFPSQGSDNFGIYRAPVTDPHERDEEMEDYLGWECVRCHLILAPHVDHCERCAPPWEG